MITKKLCSLTPKDNIKILSFSCDGNMKRIDMKNLKLIIVYLLLNLLLCSCSNKEEINIDNDNYNKQQENKKISNLIELFKKKYPNTTIIQENEYHLEDGTYVYAFLYANPIDYENTSTTNICFLTETSINAVDLAGEDLD